MFRTNRKRLILFVIIFFVSMLLLIRDSYAAPTVTIIVNPPETTEVLRAGSDPIGLAAQAGGPNLTFLWELVGPGKLEGDPEGSSVFFRPPDRIDGESTEAVITVTVTDSTGEKTTESKTFTIKSKGMSTLTKTAIGVGAAAALGVGVCLAVDCFGGDDNSRGPFSGSYIQQAVASDWRYTRTLVLSQKGNTVTGTYQVELELFGCCSGTTPTVDVTGEVQEDTGALLWGPVHGECECSRDQFAIDEINGTHNVTTFNDGAMLRIEYPDPEDGFTIDFYRQSK